MKAGLISVLLFGCSAMLHSQDIALGTWAGRDNNIFDISSPTPDQITQFSLDASKDWDVNQLSMNLSYTGSLLLFRDLPARNYHIHWLTFSSTYQFQAPEEDEDDSASIAPRTEAASDSACRSLSATLTGGSQFDREKFSQYNNSMASCMLVFRQPLGELFSVRPSYTLSYHSYPDLSAITNIQNIVAVHIGITGPASSWVAVSPSFALKRYPSSSSITYTVPVVSSGGHGKGGGGGQATTRTTTFDMTNPSVTQASLSISIKQTVAPGTEVDAEYTSIGSPSSEARVIPQQIQGLLQERGAMEEFVLQNDIFDDRFSYYGDDFTLGVTQALPFALTLGVRGGYQHKNYTYPAKDLADSLVLAPSREDRRSDVSARVTRTFAIGTGRSLKAEIEFHYLKNKSNAPYYDFDKTAWMAGIELGF